jgi:sulfane dehydrogenase subunit SoxC
VGIDATADRTGAAEAISPEELRLATRNHGTPLEALRYAITPVGLHYLLTHYDIPMVDPAAWRLTVDGAVRTPLSLSLDDLRARPATTLAATFECAGNGRALLNPRPVSQPWLLEAVGTGEWTGTALQGVLEEAGLGDDGSEVVFTGLDRGVEADVEQDYRRSLPLPEAMGPEVLLAYALNGAPLPPQHGFPLRLIVPGWYGMTNVKWLGAITVAREPFDGYQQARSYRFRQSDDEDGTPVTRMMPRALMVPPGIPDFMSRRRFVANEPVTMEGRAWSGWGPIERVEVSADGGLTWHRAALGDAPSAHAWRAWTFEWRPDGPGPHELRCRVHDAAGHTQPDDGTWNTGGYANNAVQRVEVTVRG